MENLVNHSLKLTAAALVVFAIGLPILETWEALFLAVSVLAITFGDTRADWRRVVLAGGIVAAALGVKATLPRADISESHNAFLVMGAGEALERGLPPDIFQSWRAQFDALYPPDPPPYEERSQWRTGGVPATLFTRSSDAIWRRSAHTRQVDAIDFRSLGEFRGGFANELQYNFWKGELLREWMPFYVNYELTPASAGSALAWKGQVFWEGADGRFQEIVHPQMSRKPITSADAGKHVYAAFFPKRDATIEFSLEPSVGLRLAALLKVVLTLIGGFAAVLLLVRPRWRSCGRALVLFTAGYLVIVAFISVSAGKYLGRTYPPHGGGDDGLVHDGWGRAMAMLAGAGDIRAALEGFEPVYWFTPGMRYVRMVEKIIFGDTNLLYTLIVATAPIVMFYLLRQVTNTRWAWVGTGLFCLAPVGNPSLLQYIANAKLGYGEAFGGALFLFGVFYLIKTTPVWGGSEQSPIMAGIAGAALALSLFVRPNFVFAVLWLAAAYSWAAWRRRAQAMILALAAGLMLALWMPFHNWYYGGELHVISRNAAVAFPLGPRQYVSATVDMVHGRSGTPATKAVLEQLSGWLGNPGFVVTPGLRPVAWAAHGVKLLALAATVMLVALAIARRRGRTTLVILAVTAVCAHLPMFFVHSPLPRYDMLGWDLSVVTLFAWCHDVWTRTAARRTEVQAA